MDATPGSHIDFDELVSNPIYRVHIWSLRAERAPNLESHVLRGANDVREALTWAEAAAAGRPWELFAQVEVRRVLGSDPEEWWVRLFGESPVDV